MRCPVCNKDNPSGAEACEFCRTPLLNAASRFQPTAPVSGMTVLDAGYEPGSLIAGRYLSVRELGRGGMGVVYLVQDQQLRGKEVALKLVSSALTANPQAQDRFVQEVLTAQELTHENVIKVFHLDASDGQSFFTMEYVPGKSLRDILEERKAAGKTFTLKECEAVLLPVLEALAHAHRRNPPVIHRDIKPDNIIVNGSLASPQVKVLDFGLAKLFTPSQLTSTAMAMGTAYYMAPEQIKGARDIDPRADLFSVGVMFYEMLTGVIPSGRFDLPADIDTSLPVEVNTIVDTALKRQVEQRYQSASDFADALKALSVAPGAKSQAPKRMDGPVSAPAPQNPVSSSPGHALTQPASRLVQSAPQAEPTPQAEQKPVSTPKPEAVASVFALEEPVAVPVPGRKSRGGKWLLLLVLALVGVGGGYFFVTQLGYDSSLSYFSESSANGNNHAMGDVWRDPATGMEFAWVPGSCFEMGGNDGAPDEKPAHTVCVDGFWMGRTEVTNAQYRLFRPAHDSRDYKGNNLNGDSQPVVYVTLDDARAYAAWLSGGGNGKFRLPTEAEWEMAARGPDGDEVFAGSNSVDQVAWYGANSKLRSHNVATKAPNGFGIYDMSGNAWEWCEDVHDERAYSKLFMVRDNPLFKGNLLSSDLHVVRGGCWDDSPSSVKVVNRGKFDRNKSYCVFGFRLIRKE